MTPTTSAHTDPLQQQTISRLDADLASLVAAQAPSPRQRLKAFLTQVNGAWFDDHARDPTLYAKELASWNSAAGWKGKKAQVAAWSGHLLTPKFFGGAVEKLDDDYVLSLSLNHKQGDDAAFRDEVNDTQTKAQRLAHCFEYFQRPYAYKNFFERRAHALESYRRARTPTWVSPPCAAHVGSSPDWRCLNEPTALYVEAYPTWSPKSAPPAAGRSLPVTFLVALNRLVHQAILSLFPPRALLAAGLDAIASLDLLESQGLIRVTTPWQDITSTVILNPRKKANPRVETAIGLCPGGTDVRLVKCGFLGWPSGPMSHPEKVLLGVALAQP